MPATAMAHPNILPQLGDASRHLASALGTLQAAVVATRAADVAGVELALARTQALIDQATTAVSDAAGVLDPGDEPDDEPAEAWPGPLHPPAVLVGGRVPAHAPGAYPSLDCCGGRVQLDSLPGLAQRPLHCADCGGITPTGERACRVCGAPLHQPVGA